MTDQQKPWGDDENFDADKAWTLIQNLRAERDQAKADRDALTRERDTLAARTSDLEAAAQSKDAALAEKDRELLAANTLRAKENLLVDAGLPRDLASNVVGDDEEAWKNDVQRFAALRGEVRQERTPDPAQAAAPQIDERTALANRIFGSD